MAYSKRGKFGPASKKASLSGFKVAEFIISRRNRNGTIVLMKTDKAVSFYRIDGIATEAWRCLETPQTIETIVSHLNGLYPKKTKTMSRDVTAFVKKLLRLDLITPTKGPYGTKFPPQLDDAVKFDDFGTVEEFNLEKIEKEVLNDSLYLDVFAGSDLRLKTEIAPIENALSKVLQLDGITHSWKKKTGISNPKAKRAGLIAQQVAMQMPELVRRSEESGVLAVDYQKLNAYLVESIKELSRIIVDQDSRLRKLENKPSLKQ